MHTDYGKNIPPPMFNLQRGNSSFFYAVNAN